LIAGAGARCERASGRTINQPGPSARGEPPGLGRREPTVGGVRRDLVVAPPAIEQTPGLDEVLEDLLVQQLVAQRPMRRSTNAFCCGLPGDQPAVKAVRFRPS
jgi:hypothetical protein